MSGVESLNKFKKAHSIFVIGHKGANAECPENTMLSFETAAEIRADMIEFDIHKTIDDEIVIIHDTLTRRVSDVSLNVEEVPYSELKDIDLGEGQKIPRLDEVFEKLKGKIAFQIEIKQAGIAELLLEKINKYGVHDDCLISSFNVDELERFRELDKSIPMAILEPTITGWFTRWFTRKQMMENVINRHIPGLHPSYKFVNEYVMKFARENNLFIIPWTPDRESDWEKLIKKGVDGIITNNPRKLIEYLQRNN